MIKHVGKHGDRKVAIVFREVPNEEHMALVIYPDTLPMTIHDRIMAVLESELGQQAESLGDALFRSLLADGRPILQTLHSEGMIKKVQTKQIVVTPNATSHVNLEEMNRIIREMKTGKDAIQRLADIENNRGMSNYKRKDDFGREIGAPVDGIRGSNVAGSDAARALDDAALAETFRDQAKRMASEAKQLLAESERLMNEANGMSGVAPVAPAPARRGRKKSSTVVANANAG
jgi:hypothetical protein